MQFAINQNFEFLLYSFTFCNSYILLNWLLLVLSFKKQLIYFWFVALWIAMPNSIYHVYWLGVFFVVSQSVENATWFVIPGWHRKSTFKCSILVQTMTFFLFQVTLIPAKGLTCLDVIQHTLSQMGGHAFWNYWWMKNEHYLLYIKASLTSILVSANCSWIFYNIPQWCCP